MIYFTDMLLIPGEGNSSEDLRKAMAGTGMVKCAQVDSVPDITFDGDRLNDEWTKSYAAYKETKEWGPSPYADQVKEKIMAIMNGEQGSVGYEVGGELGGPGGYDDAYGAPIYEKEVASPILEGGKELVIKLECSNEEICQGAMNILEDLVYGEKGDEQKIETEPVGEDILKVFWVYDESQVDEGPDYEPDDDWDDDRDYGPPADYDPYGGP